MATTLDNILNGSTSKGGKTLSEVLADENPMYGKNGKDIQGDPPNFNDEPWAVGQTTFDKQNEADQKPASTDGVSPAGELKIEPKEKSAEGTSGNGEGGEERPAVQSVMNASGTTVDPSKVAAPITTPESKLKLQPRPQLTYEQMLARLNWEDPEEKKRQRNRQIIGAVGDGIAALANLVATTKGAPNAYDPKEGLTEKMRARYDQLTKDRKDDLLKQYQMRMAARQADEASTKWREQLEVQKASARLAQANEQRAELWKRLEYEQRERKNTADLDLKIANLDAQIQHWEDIINAANNKTATQAQTASDNNKSREKIADKNNKTKKEIAGKKGKLDW